jgi:hypothetical protein
LIGLGLAGAFREYHQDIAMCFDEFRIAEPFAPPKYSLSLYTDSSPLIMMDTEPLGILTHA